MCEIAEYAGMYPDPDWPTCIALATSSNPPCMAYAPALGKYVRYYSGGASAPIVQWLDSFAKLYAENRRLGSEFMQAITDTVISDTKSYPRLRQAFVACNLISPKIVDGVSKLLVKSDIQKLAKEQYRRDIDEAESDYELASKYLEACVEDGAISQATSDGIYGRFLVRVVLLLTAKGKSGFEGKEYKSVGDIKSTLVAELKEAAGGHTFPSSSWYPTAPATRTVTKSPAASSAAAATPSQQKSSAVSFEDLNDSAWVAGQQGYTTGTIVFEKAVGTQCLFKIEEVSSTVKLSSLDLGLGKPSVIEAPLELVIKSWQIYKGTIPTLVDKSWTSFTLSGISELSVTEAAKATLFLAVRELHASVQLSVDDVAPCLNPTNVFALKAFKRGELVFVPTVLIKDITTKQELGR